MSFDDFSDLVEAHLMQEQEWTEIQVADFISPRTRRLIMARCLVGWLMGLEPTTTGITILCIYPMLARVSGRSTVTTAHYLSTAECGFQRVSYHAKIPRQPRPAGVSGIAAGCNCYFVQTPRT